MMQSVIFTPPRVNWYVRDALAALRYKENCHVFGMFFIELENPNYPWSIEQLPEVNNTIISRELKIRRFRTYQPQPERREENDDIQYPLGKAPTWQEISSSLQSNPTILIPQWAKGLPEEVQRYNDCEEGSAEYYAGQIFVTFTRHIWISLNAAWRVRPQTQINPLTLAEALECWSVDFVLAEVTAPGFKPSNTGLHGGTGRRTVEFSDRRRTYFPDENIMKNNNIWRKLAEEPGYIWKYQECLRIMGERGEELKGCLEELLDQCQCLPDSSHRKNEGWIWKVDKKKIIVITNPKFYRIKEIGKIGSGKSTGESKGLRAPPAQRNLKETVVEMLEQEGYRREVAERAVKQIKSRRKRNETKSAKTKNRREPPRRIKGRDLSKSVVQEKNEKDGEQGYEEEEEEEEEEEQEEEQEQEEEEEQEEEHGQEKEDFSGDESGKIYTCEGDDEDDGEW